MGSPPTPCITPGSKFAVSMFADDKSMDHFGCLHPGALAQFIFETPGIQNSTVTDYIDWQDNLILSGRYKSEYLQD